MQLPLLRIYIIYNGCLSIVTVCDISCIKTFICIMSFQANMNSCLQKPCPLGFAFFKPQNDPPIQIDHNGAFRYKRVYMTLNYSFSLVQQHKNENP